MEGTEELETGWGAHAPAGDNLCNDYAQALADGLLELARARDEAVLDDGDVALCDGGSPSPFGNLAAVRRPLSEDGWRKAAARADAFYGRRPGAGFLLFSAWPTPDLSPLGFTLVGHPPLMYRPPGPLAVPPLDGVEVRSVTDEAGAADWERTLVEGFPVAELQPWRRGCLLPAVTPPRWRYWVAYLDGERAACASARLCDRHVDVQFVATLDAARRRGIGAAVTAAATLADPALPAMLVASDPGRPVYQRLGYRSLLRFTMWTGRRPT
ncbi:MAG TPA: GNAT family N-acetyltransferase [Acidimicrobiales bacterium]|nr:GNAT family N-acetyltransferase [Acidimicrobiales bacterium]